MKLNKPQVADIFERALWTFVQTFAGVLLASNVLDLVVVQNAAEVALASAIASLLSLLKGFASSQLGLGSASSLPVHLEPEPNGKK